MTDESFNRLIVAQGGCSLFVGALAQRVGLPAILGAVVGAAAGVAIWWMARRAASRRAG